MIFMMTGEAKIRSVMKDKVVIYPKKNDNLEKIWTLIIYTKQNIRLV